MSTFRAIIYAACICCVAGNARAAEDAAQLALGASLSAQLCASCHQVSPEHKRPGRVYNAKTHEAGYAPSFMDIAKGPNRAQSIDKTILEPHYPMNRRVFRDTERQAIILYIQSLGR